LGDPGADSCLVDPLVTAIRDRKPEAELIAFARAFPSWPSTKKTRSRSPHRIRVSDEGEAFPKGPAEVGDTVKEDS
ncbi:MAG: hypothetical protein GY724_02155, partial [Actinomycetia bacterium]|nr:hypothetical protein [Actinomycetes bacterium]